MNSYASGICNTFTILQGWILNPKTCILIKNKIMTSGFLKMQGNPQVPHIVLAAELRFDKQSWTPMLNSTAQTWCNPNAINKTHLGVRTIFMISTQTQERRIKLWFFMVSTETQKTKREGQVVTLILAYFSHIFQLSALPQKNYKNK